MIYGINFGAPPIPDTPRSAFRKFPRRVRVGFVGRSAVWATLVGIGQSETERDAMLIQAHNGRCSLHTEARKTAGGTWYGIYTY